MSAAAREVSERLREAIDAWPGGGVNAFADAVAALGGRGTSRAMVLRYLSRANPKKVPPPLDFLAVAAEVLKVRKAWLAWGDGERTEAEQAGASAGVDPLDRAILDAAEAAFADLRNADWLARAILIEEARALVFRLEECEPYSGTPELERASEAGSRIGRALNAFAHAITGREDGVSPFTGRNDMLAPSHMVSEYVRAAAGVVGVAGNHIREAPFRSIAEAVFPHFEGTDAGTAEQQS